jgi:tRNA nucleotidyltransferase (CCA-adding enzyme)
VEDFTNQGISDLKKGMINMPKDAKISFDEDPLRILRIIRFATRFNFSLSENIVNNLFISDEFKNIISRQRIEKEFSKMMENENYYASVYILYKYKYLDYILNIDENDKLNINIDNQKMINSAVNLILIKSYIDKNKDYFNEANNDSKNKNNYKLLNYACLLLSYKNYEIPESKNKSIILSKIIAAKKLLLPKSDINDIILKIEGENELINFLKKSKEEIFKRYNISQYLIKYKYKNLVDIIKLAICDEYLNIKNRDNNEIIESIDNDIIKSLYEKYKEIVEYIKKEKMENIENIKPLLDGKEIIKILNIKDGKKIKNFLDLILKEQINNPNITKDDCINLIKAQQ